MISSLIGKTIKSATPLHYPGHDDRAWLELAFTDGSSVIIVATYGVFTGKSLDEYPAFIHVESPSIYPGLVSL